MEVVKRYRIFEQRILLNLKNNGLNHRTKCSAGLWLGPLVGLSAIVTMLQEDSHSEICLLSGITGIGLVMSCACIFGRLSMEKVAIKDFQLVYFLPAMTMSVLYSFVANKGLLVSVTWGLIVGTLSTWGVLQAMAKLPFCFTIGEALAVMHSVILFLLSAATNLPLRYHLPPIHTNDIITVILQVGILYVASLCLLCVYIPIFRIPKYFYTITIGALLLIIIPSLHLLLDQSVFLWIFYYLFEKVDRIFLVLYWVLCFTCAIGAVMHQILSNSQASTSSRKTFHVLAVLVYIPGMIWEPTLLYLASGIVMGVFIMLELMRILDVPPVGELLQQGFSVFADEKDVLISLTPLYLLCGLSFPLWMPTNNLGLLSLLSGVLTVGVGDTAASFIGNKWGQHKWSGSKKSMEGTIACILAQLTVIYGLAYFGNVPDGCLLIRATLAVAGVSLVEAWTNQVDNLALPLVMYLTLGV